MKTNPVEYNAQMKELFDILMDFPDGDLIEALMDNQNYTKRGRLKKSRICRALGINGKVYESRAEKLRERLTGLEDGIAGGGRPGEIHCHMSV